MGCSSVSTAQEGGDISVSSLARGSSLGQAVNQPVGAPVHRGDDSFIAFCGDADGSMGLVRRKPNELAVAHDGSQVVANQQAQPWPTLWRGARRGGWRWQRRRAQWTARPGSQCAPGKERGTGSQSRKAIAIARSGTCHRVFGGLNDAARRTPFQYFLVAP